MCGEVDMLTKIERREERQKLRGESVCRIIEMKFKVTGDDKFVTALPPTQGSRKNTVLVRNITQRVNSLCFIQRSIVIQHLIVSHAYTVTGRYRQTHSLTLND